MKIKNVSGEDRLVSWLGGRLVFAGQEVDVPESDVYNYTQQSVWDPADDEAQAVHDREAAPIEALVEALGDPDLEPPARNASRDEWAAYAVAAGLVPDLDALDGKGRDEIRDTYAPEEVN